MFINFEILLEGHSKEKVELVVSSPKEAVSLFSFFEDSSKVVAWKCTTNKPEDFGCASSVSGYWKKLRLEGFIESDFT